MYLGKKSLELLQIFLAGYSHAITEINYRNGFEACHKSYDFQQFIMTRYNIYSYYNAYGIIRLQCSSDEEAFDMFFKLLDEFLATCDDNLK
jgi:hypothetical protein